MAREREVVKVEMKAVLYLTEENEKFKKKLEMAEKVVKKRSL